MKHKNEKYNQGSHVLFSLVAATIILGITLGFLYGTSPANNPQDSQQNCELVGREWSEGESRCLLGNKKTGEACTDGGQCESGACRPPVLTEAQKAALASEPLENVIGTCYANEEVQGCVEQVILGMVTEESMCLD